MSGDPHEIQSDCLKCNGSRVYGTVKCDACGVIYTRPVNWIEPDPLVARLKAAELLLQEAETCIEILMEGERAPVLEAIEEHWQTYPEPLA
jgi:hypothetical protein